jgi:CRP-like cAMP-binding protein
LDRIQFLKTVPFFDQLSNRQLKRVSDIMFERTYETDELIFEEGQPGAALFLILDGKIAIEIYRESSTTRLAVLEAGAFFGEMALLNETPRSATARAWNVLGHWRFIGTTLTDWFIGIQELPAEFTVPLQR